MHTFLLIITSLVLICCLTCLTYNSKMGKCKISVLLKLKKNKEVGKLIQLTKLYFSLTGRMFAI